MADFVIKRNDTSPGLQDTLLDPAGNVVDISGGSLVRFHMYAQDRTTLVVDASATIVDGPNGVVRYSWETQDTANAGWYWFEWEVTRPDTTIETYPNSGYKSVKMDPDLS